MKQIMQTYLRLCKSCCVPLTFRLSTYNCPNPVSCEQKQTISVLNFYSYSTYKYNHPYI